MEAEENKILYIDDEDLNLLLFEAYFSKHFQVHTARNSVEAELLMNNTAFKVVISDINMPNENGLDFIKRFNIPGNEPIFIILSAFISNDLLLEALHQGKIYRYLTKPWKFEEVKVVIDQAIELYDLRFNNDLLFVSALETRHNFYNIFQSSLDCILVFDNHELIKEANKAFLNAFGSDNYSVSGRKLNECIPDDLFVIIQRMLKEEALPDTQKCNIEYITRGEPVKYYALDSSTLEYESERVNMVILHDITERREDEHRILNAVIQAEERERSRLAKDLHDGLGPIMATLKMYLEWLCDKKKVSDHPDILKLSLSTINEAIVTLKNISNNLSPHILEKFGLQSALNTYVDKVRKIVPMQFSLDINVPERFALAVEMSVYRIITECINNTIKHSKATEVWLFIETTARKLHLNYKDNGIGFILSQNHPSEVNGMGLHNIINRIKTLDGNIEISTHPGKGFKIEIEIPLN
jgi:PAS domain S-box-containing protein